jgi:hypothetical protein
LERYLRAADILLLSAFLQALYGAFVLSFLLGTQRNRQSVLQSDQKTAGNAVHMYVQEQARPD